MPLLKHAIKKMRQDKKRTLANKTKKATLRTALKKARSTGTAENLSAAFAKLDKAAKTHLIHRNKASRLKSRLAKAIAKMTGSTPTKKVKAAETVKETKTPVKRTRTKKTVEA